MFSKTFYANTRSKSNTGAHNVACYTGSAQEIVNSFFTPVTDLREGIAYINQNDLSATASSDGKIIGVTFRIADSVTQSGIANLKGRAWHFRIPHCMEGGKTALFTQDVKVVEYDMDVMSKRSPAGLELPDVPVAEDGFKTLDAVAANAPVKDLPRFQVRSDYDRVTVKSNDRPWRGLDLSNPAEAERFALMLQEYAYDGMANQDSQRTDYNFITENNSVRDWCHMPWLNVGESGRECIHGLTKERDLYPSNIYPTSTPGSDWGIGFYNAVGCKAIERVFGNKNAAKSQPDFLPSAVSFNDGTVSAKILFTTADFPELEGAYTWNANVSQPKSTVRRVTPVRHVQMDIAVKDSTLKGTLKEMGHWVMITYYFDKSYTTTLSMPGLPEGLRHMRPQGIQFGVGERGSTIFAGAKTNHPKGLLNGPADNPKSSCLGCHATAGTKFGMSPGFTSEVEFAKLGNNHLDFSQQLALAKRNFETRTKSGATKKR